MRGRWWEDGGGKIERGGEDDGRVEEGKLRGEGRRVGGWRRED